MRHLISSRDQLLLQRQFRVSRPQDLPGLTLRVERSVKADKIAHWYDETNSTPGNNKPIVCAFGHHHGKGFVVDLEDGRTVLVGKDCAQKDFGFDFDGVVKSFRTEEDRQFQIRRLLAIHEMLPAAQRELETLADSLAVTAFDYYWQSFGRDFGKLSQHLARVVRSSQGRLMATKMVYSEAATERAAQAAARKLVQGDEQPSLYERISLSRSERERERAEREWYAFIATQPKQYVTAPLDLGPCDGWALTRASERSTPARRIAEARALAGGLDLHRPTERWGRRDFAILRRSLETMFEALDDAARLAGELAKFASSENIKRIAAWAHQVEMMDHSIGHIVKANGRALIGRARLELPVEYAWPSTPHLDVLRDARGRIDGRHSEPREDNAADA